MVSVRSQIIAAVLLLIVLGAKVWFKVQATSLGYELAKERDLTVQYDMEMRDLDLQLSVLMRPDNLAQRANERLGLVPLRPEQARKIKINQ